MFVFLQTINLFQIYPEVSPGSSLYAVLDFMERLCERSEDGRVLIRTTGLLYILLNPNQHFIPLVEDSRSVNIIQNALFFNLLSSTKRMFYLVEHRNLTFIFLNLIFRI